MCPASLGQTVLGIIVLHLSLGHALHFAPAIWLLQQVHVMDKDMDKVKDDGLLIPCPLFSSINAHSSFFPSMTQVQCARTAEWSLSGSCPPSSIPPTHPFSPSPLHPDLLLLLLFFYPACKITVVPCSIPPTDHFSSSYWSSFFNSNISYSNLLVVSCPKLNPSNTLSSHCNHPPSPKQPISFWHSPLHSGISSPSDPYLFLFRSF